MCIFYVYLWSDLNKFNLVEWLIMMLLILCEVAEMLILEMYTVTE